MRVAILYICTGKYSVFWAPFFASSEEFFVPDEEKVYFVFTDSEGITPAPNVKVIYSEPRGFPLDSLLRFEMFSTIKNELVAFDYIFFFNSNMRIVRKIEGRTFLPSLTQKLVGVQHPGYYNKRKFWFPYEKSRKSKAFVSYASGREYFMGSFNGGEALEYLLLVEECMKNIRADLDAGIIAEYHDESHLNKYFSERPVHVLSPSYAFPEGASLPYSPKIVITDKVKAGGKYFDKLPARAYYKRIRRIIRSGIQSLWWMLRI